MASAFLHMRHRRLGSSGLTISPLALGTMTWGHAVDVYEAKEHLATFVSAGGNLVDTAYGEVSLIRLGTDHVDLWLVHTWSDEAPLTKTLSALEWGVTSGRARYVGVSNYSGWQSARASSILEGSRIPLVANEVQYSLVHRATESEIVPAATALGLGLLAWSPLGRGVLTGKYRNGVPSRVACRAP